MPSELRETARTPSYFLPPLDECPDNNQQYRKRRWITGGVISVLALFLLTVFIINPSGNLVNEEWISYALLHVILETLSVIFALMIFGIGWHTYGKMVNTRLLILSCSFLLMGILDIIHMLSYPGMPDFITPSGNSKSIYFWLSARLVGLLTLLLAILIPWKPIKQSASYLKYVILAVGLAVVSVITWIGFAHIELVPATFIEGKGLTPLKVALEYVIVGLCGLAAVGLLLQRNKQRFYNTDGMLAGIVVLGLSEMWFTLYFSESDVFNLLGHLYKIIACIYFYRAVFVNNVKEPYERLYHSQSMLRKSEEWLSITFKSIRDAVLSTDASGRVLFINPHAEEILGCSLKEAEGKHINDIFRVINGTAREPVESSVERAIREGAVVGLPPDTLLIAKNGMELPIDDSTAPIYNDEGEMMGVVMVFRDVTERKRKEEQQQLELRARELENKNQMLAEAKELSDSASRIKSEFIANMSHEIRTPMNAILGFNYLLRQTDLSYKQKEYVDKTIFSAKSLLAIISDILDFSKIEANKMMIENIDFDLYEVLSGVSNMMSFKAYEKGIKLQFLIHHEVPQIMKGDPYRLNQVLLNLASNAIKFTDEGEVKISVRMLEHTANEVSLQFDVEDTGAGITEAQQAQLFQGFSQADMSTTRRYGGTGLGLVISKSLVELMGGTIGMESEVGQGSRFYFTARFERSTEILFKVDKHFDMKFLHVMLICDDPEIQIILRNQLEQFQFIVNLTSSDTEQITQSFHHSSYDLVIIDQHLNGADALSLAQQIKENHNIPVPMLAMVTQFHETKLHDVDYYPIFEKILYFPISQSELFNEIISLFRARISNQSLKQRTGQSETFTALRHAKVLLVEDNDINQLVAKEILKEIGVELDVCWNGAEALKKVGSKRYDAILMDLQMPVMDGFEATRCIRELDNGADVPVIAMTADALKGTEEQVLASGMNAYITKPFEPIQLFSVLQRMIQQHRGYGHQNTELLAAVPGIQVQEMLAKLNNNKALFLQLLQKFVEEHVDSLLTIKQDLLAGNLKEALFHTHTLKGVAASIGAAQLVEAANQLYVALRENPDDVPDQLFETAQHKLLEVVVSTTKLHRRA